MTTRRRCLSTATVRLLTLFLALSASLSMMAQLPWRPPSLVDIGRACLLPPPAYDYVDLVWHSRPLAFPLPKADDAPELTDPFGGGEQVVIHFENYSDHDWCYPVPGAHVTSHYGWRGKRGHSGTDIKTFGEDRICAAFDGKVVRSEPYSGYGNCIVISHSNGLTTLYSHNLRNMVEEGEQVTAGQVIALIGRTGHATGDHLHFECRVQGVAFDSSLIFDHDHSQLHRRPVVLTRGGAVHVGSGHAIQ